MLRLLRTFTLATTSFFLATAVAAADEAVGGEYLFLLKGRGNVFWKVIRQGVEETAKERGITATVLHTDDDQTPEAQLNMCLAALPRKPKVIVMGAHTRTIGLECFKQAAALGITVADIDGNVTVEDAKSAGIRLAFSVGSDNALIGQKAAQHLAKISRRASPRILVIKGLPGSIVSEQRSKGFLDRIASEMPGAVVVGSPSADWDRMKAMSTATDYMQREPELDYIFSVSDVMTMGVVEAVKVAGRAGQVKILSVDGIADARKAVLDGSMEANVAQLPFLMGKRAVELSVTATAEGTKDLSEFVPTPVLTKAILTADAEPELSYLR